MSQLHSAGIAVPDKLGPYRIVRELGRGGMGCVYEAVDERLQRRVAIKMLRAELAADPKQVERFVREGRAACHIRHPHVIDVFELGFEQARPYLVMDFLPGITLAERLKQAGRLDLPELLSVLLPVLSAVAAAHAAGIVHRDLKPDNIMLALDARGRTTPKVLDFGISKVLAKDAASLTLTTTFAVLGTPYYMSPEQTRASREVDAQTDQYTLAVILYECATGLRPFDGENQYALMHAIMTAPVVPPSVHVPSLPREFDAVVLRAMSRAPAERFASVNELGAALLRFAPGNLAEAFRAEFGAGPTAAPAHSEERVLDSTLRTVPMHVAAPQRQIARAAAAVLCALVVLGVGVYAFFRDRPHGQSVIAAPSAMPAPADLKSVAAPNAAAPAPAAIDGDSPVATPVTAPQALQSPQLPAAPSSAPRTQPKAATPHPARVRNKPSPVTFGENGAPILE